MNLHQALDNDESRALIVSLIDELQGHLDVFEQAHDCEKVVTEHEIAKINRAASEAMLSMQEKYHEIIDVLSDKAEIKAAEKQFMLDMQEDGV